MPYRIDPNTGQPVWDGTSIPQASRDSLAAQIRSLQDQIDNLSFIDLDDVPATYTGQSGKIVSVKSTEDGLEFITNTGGGGVTDGDKGDITVAGSGATWTIDASAVTEAKIADGAVTANKIGTGAVGPTQLASTAVTAGSYTLANITVDADGRITAASNGTAGSGTVTTVSVATANGVSGTVANATTTPAITISLGAITPSSVNGVTITDGGSGALTVTSTASVSGSNTGDVTLNGSGMNYLSRTNQVLTANAIDLASHVTGDLPLANLAQASAASRLLGRGSASGAGDFQEISLGSGLSMSGTQLIATAGSGDVVGPASATDNAIVRFDLTTGKLVQDSAILIQDAEAVTSANVRISVNHSGQTNSALVLQPMGTGALILGPSPDGGATTGGNARGANAVDLQFTRTSAASVASGQESFVGGGTNQRASATQSFCIGGSSNQATGTRSGCIGGTGAQATATDSFTIGQLNSATATSAVAVGLQTIANRIGYRANAYGRFSSNGDAQCGSLTVRRQTTDATQTELSIDGAAPSGATITTSNKIVLLNSQTVMVDVYVVARSTSGTDDACYHRRCLITRDANAGTTAIVGLVQTIGTDIETTGASAWDVTLAADTTNGALQVLVTGAAGVTINWFAEVVLREVIR